MCGPAPCKEIVPACSPRPTLSPSHFIKRVRDPSRRRSSVRRPRRPRDVDSATASDEAGDAPLQNSWVCVCRRHPYITRGCPGLPGVRAPVAGTRRTVPDVRTSSSQGALESRPPAAWSGRSFVHQPHHSMAWPYAAREEIVSATLVSKAADSDVKPVPLPIPCSQ